MFQITDKYVYTSNNARELPTTIITFGVLANLCFHGDGINISILLSDQNVSPIQLLAFQSNDAENYYYLLRGFENNSSTCIYVLAIYMDMPLMRISCCFENVTGCISYWITSTIWSIDTPLLL